MGLGDRERIGHVQFQVCFLGGESNYDSCPIACPIRTTGKKYPHQIPFCYELSNDFLEPTEIVDCHGEFLEGSHKTMAGYGTKMGSTILEPNLDQGPQDLYPLTREPDGFS